MRLGMICRHDNSGLATLAMEFSRHLKPEKVLLVENGVFQTFPERYKDFTTRRVDGHSSISPEDRAWLMDGVDVILSFETFYSQEIVPEARKKGVKTVLMTMAELFPQVVRHAPDLYICPSKLDMDIVPEPKVYLPVPVATDRLIWQKRTTAHHFIHSASHGGVALRKGTPLLLEALPFVQSKDIKITIYSWRPFTCDDPRVEIKVMNFKNYWQLWREGDVLIYPQNANGICLPVAEAYASGLGVLTTDIYPFNEWLPREMMFQPSGYTEQSFGTGLVPVQIAQIKPELIALAIDEWANKDISKLSVRGHAWAQENSWEKLLPEYLKVLENLCRR